MGERCEYEMTREQLDRLLEAARPVPMIALQCGAPVSPQENANSAWATLGREMGFDDKTAQPLPLRGNRFFTAASLGLTPEGQARTGSVNQ